MTLPTGYALAMDAQFRELGNFTTPPRAGRITAIEGNGQVRVATDDPDGGDVLAWPLNGFSYAVNDVVYVAFAVNNPESAIVIGSKGATPTLSAYLRRSGADTLTGDWDVGEDRRILLEALRARDGEGIAFEDDAGNVALLVNYGGFVAIGAVTAQGKLHVYDAAANVNQYIESGAGRANLFIVSPGTNKFVRFGFIQGGLSGTNRFDIGMAEDSSGNLYVGDTNLATKFLTVAPTGNVGVGDLTSPQGKLHVYDGTGGMMFVTKSGVTGTVQTVLANGSGDVTKALAGFYVWSDAASGISSNFVMQPGDNVDTSFNGNTWRIALNVNGTLTVQRTAGTGTGSVALMFCWI